MGTTAVRVETRTGTNITKTGYGYEITKSSGNNNFYQVQVSDFEFGLLSVIVMGDALLFEVEVNGGRVLDGTVFQVPSDLFSSMPRFKKWCQGRELEWSGDQAALDGVYSLLNHQDVPRRRGVSVVGLHKTANGFTWVLPDESFGADPDDIVYVPPPAGDLWSKGVNLVEDGNYNLRAVELLAQLHDPKVMTPILGWMAAAPLRSQCPKFPPLIVTGRSGYGKTTILETVMRTFGYWTEPAISLGSATPYTVDAYCASSNGLPDWFDEYRGSKFGRLETRLAIQQAVRDAFDGASTPKGGGGENHLGIINQPKIAPLMCPAKMN